MFSLHGRRIIVFLAICLSIGNTFKWVMPQHEEDIFLSHSLPETPHLSDLNKEGSCCKFILNVNDLICNWITDVHFKDEE